MGTSDCRRRARPLLGTFVEIAVGAAAPAAAEAAIEAAFAAIATVHRLMSFHDPASDVSRLNREAAQHAVAVDAWTCQVLEIAAAMHRASAGAFDIAVAPALQRLGLLPGGDRRASVNPAPTAAAIELLSGRRVRFHEPCVVDLGGIAKGFAVDRAVDVLRRHGMPCGLVNAGGDLAAFGPCAHPVHIRDPRRPGQPMLQVAIRDGALATSGGRLDPVLSGSPDSTAVIEPASGEPARAVLGASIRAPTCVVADALAKVVMIAGEASIAVLETCRASAVFVGANGDLHVTGDWQDAVRLAA
jgi:thiamine biosynthesis lipoprotein